jgi:hypothetical protein
MIHTVRTTSIGLQVLRCGLGVLFILSISSGLYGQSCPMCYSTAANSGAQFVQALKHGILILLFPSLFIGLLVVAISYRKRNQYAQH